MKKDTVPQMVEAKALKTKNKTKAAAKNKGGRPKERVQLSVRFDRIVADMIFRYLERHPGDRMTDILERGALLALNEREELNREPVYINARMHLNDLGVDAARDVTSVCLMRYFPEVRPLTQLEKEIRDFYLKIVNVPHQWPDSELVLRKLAETRNEIVHGVSRRNTISPPKE